MKAEKMSVFRILLSACPYTHLWDVIKTSIKKRKFTAASRQGLFIMLLGVCCPLFWIALFSGASGAELKFHATHSASVAGIGLVIMILGLKKNNK